MGRGNPNPKTDHLEATKRKPGEGPKKGPQRGLARAAAQKIKSARLMAELLELRLQGLTLREIEKRMPMSRNTASLLLMSAMRELEDHNKEQSTVLRGLESEKLSRLEAVLLQRVSGVRWTKDVMTKEGPMTLNVDGAEIELKTVDRILKIHDAQANLWGLKAPLKVESEQKGAAVVSMDELAKQLSGVTLPMLSDIIAGKRIENAETVG